MPEMSKNHATALRIMASQWRLSATMLRMVKHHNIHMPGMSGFHELVQRQA